MRIREKSPQNAPGPKENGLGDADLARFSLGLGDFLGTFLPNERRQRLVEAVSLIGDQFNGRGSRKSGQRMVSAI